MAQSIEQAIVGGDFQIGAILDPKSRIAPITRSGKPVLITLSAKPKLTTPFSPWPSYDGGERCSIDLRMTPELAKLAEWIDECIQRQVKENPATWFSKVPKAQLYNSCHRTASKEAYSDTFRTKCSLREKSASFKAWDLEKQVQLTVDQLKNEVDWPNSEMAIQVQLSGMHVQSTGFGPVISVKSMGLRTASTESPFEYLE